MNDSLRMLVDTGRRSSRVLLNTLLRNGCKGEKWVGRECGLTVVILLCHMRKVVLNGEDFVFEKATEDA